MSTLQPGSQSETLSAVQPGDEFEVIRVLQCSRNLRQDRFSPGRHWRCLYKGVAVMLLVGRTGETISIPLTSSQLVEVRRIALHGSTATGQGTA